MLLKSGAGISRKGAKMKKQLFIDIRVTNHGGDHWVIRPVSAEAKDFIYAEVGAAKVGYGRAFRCTSRRLVTLLEEFSSYGFNVLIEG